MEELFTRLAPEDVERMADCHGLEPHGERPWVKHLTGGSDDHGGFYLGTTWTETPEAATVEELLDHLRRGATMPGGAAGSTHRLAQSIYAIADGYCTRDLGDGLAGRAMDPFRATLRRLGLPEGGRRRRWFSLPARLLGFGGEDEGDRRPPAPEVTWKRADRALQKAVRRFAFRARRELGRGHLAGGLGALAHLAPAAAAVTPWLFAAQAQHKDAAFLRQARRHFAAGGDTGPRPKAWFTDTYGDVNGVARTVAAVAGRSGELGRPLSVFACRRRPRGRDLEAPNVDLRLFRPLLDAPMPGYPEQRITLPPVMEVMRELEALGADEVILSTPGPLGWVGRTAARLLGLRASGVYHTDFPAYVGHLLGRGLRDTAWSVMHHFYADLDRIYVRSEAYRAQLIDRGFDAGKIHLMPPAVDLEQFRPGRRDPAFWDRRFPASASGAGDRPLRFLYVGRVSREKNLETLMSAFDVYLEGGRRGELAVVGDGPYLEELRRDARGRRDVVFTGVLHGEELATAYASADVFVFPSLTDTLGNVVLEAHASGLPAVVSDRGGPKELVADGTSGLVVAKGESRADTVRAFAEAMGRLHDDVDLRRAMGKQGAAGARGRSWDGFLEELWRPETAVERLDEVAETLGGGRIARIG